MASYKFFALAIVAIFLPTVTMAMEKMEMEYIVGDSSGWTINYNYTQWAMGKEFHVGDKLVFKYTPPNHNVFKVDMAGFKDCIKPSANLALTSGNDTVTLTTPGKKWYICGVGTHCSEFGQKLVINVVDAWAPAPPPSTAYGIVSSGYQVIMASMFAAVMIMM